MNEICEWCKAPITTLDESELRFHNGVCLSDFDKLYIRIAKNSDKINKRLKDIKQKLEHMEDLYENLFSTSIRKQKRKTVLGKGNSKRKEHPKQPNTTECRVKPVQNQLLSLTL